MSQSQPTLPSQSEFETAYQAAKQAVEQLESQIDASSIAAKIHTETGQMELTITNRTQPGMADGSAGTPQAPDRPTQADRNANTSFAAGVARGLRDRGGDVEVTDRGGAVVVHATLDYSTQ